MLRTDVFVIGGGAAGMEAALSAEAAGCSVVIAERLDRLGGILPQCVHHGFGLGWFHEDLTGPEYAARFIKRVEGSRIRVLTDTTVLSLSDKGSAMLSGPDGIVEIGFKTCVVATGCREKPIGALPVCGTRPAGIYTAGTAQRLINLLGCDVGERIVILGSGDIGMIMARRFSLRGKAVIAMVEQSDTLCGMIRNQRNCIEAFQISVMLSSTVEEIFGEGRISGVRVKNLKTGERTQLDCDTLITAVGLIPERELLHNVMTADGSLPGNILLCGNCEKIHEIVDSVSAQAEEVGSRAAAIAKQALARQ